MFTIVCVGHFEYDNLNLKHKDLAWNDCVVIVLYTVHKIGRFNDRVVT